MLQISFPSKSVILASTQAFTTTVINPVNLNETLLQETKVLLYPNPTTGNVSIELPEDTESEIKVIDITGKLVYASNQYGYFLQVNLEHLPTGVYVVHIRQSGEVYSEKLVLQKI